ncbi:UDP-N-acetyl-D-glucosamine 4,6-dehydratase [Lebetimonas natsushimae]|uniref:UDP-N-acetyl-D-glucosamine 4,6-dehydratase n=1 Tax=Lebetimonas natsushimae TaxID=1936991 RepID=A0A292Y7X6_9BACT|nr:nucleoside-diphosphate sugar epimerase/dehydratase [Lebetimonas natsushimae]GAX86862.1 UDP-N-acetyl-D-glucosamine 4,6-dehydratase [Lebetimonas natsushimae]
MKLSNLLRPTNFKRALFFITGDIIISFFTLFLSYLLRFNFSIPKEYLANFWQIAFVFIFFKLVFYYVFKLYFVSWRFFSLKELKSLILATTLAYILGGGVLLIFREFFIPFPRSVIIIDYFLSILFIGFFRISKRLIIEKISTNKTPAIIIGANKKAISLLKQDIPYSVLEVYDNKKNLIGSYIYGIKVEDVSKIDGKIKTAIITKELSQKELDKLVEFLQSKGIEDIKIYNPFEKKIKDISIEDLLARKPKDLDKNAIENFVKNKKILITGAGGSIGSEIARQCEKYKAKELILVDNSEFNLYSINEELNIKRYPCLVDVTKKEDLEEVFKKYTPEIVIHAAAYKHVPMCEYNPKSAVVNNILGTKNVIDLAIKYNIKDFILISTDKAVRPTNIMGATKRVCELYAQNIDSKNTKICAVRFGNVLGSSGSVVPKFKKLIEENKPLTVTHPEITRFFMLIPEACQLVLQAGSLAEDKEIFILDMGEPVKIVDLAKKMLKLYGKNEDNIEFIGLRPGEKLYEELLIDEADKKTKYKDIFVAKATFYDIKKLNDQIENLLQKNIKQDIIKLLREMVKEYNPND